MPQQAFSDTEQALLLELLPSHVLIVDDTIDKNYEVLIKLFQTFYAKLDNCDLKLMPETWLLDKIKNPILGFFCLSQAGKGFIFPFTNLGQLHINLTFANVQFQSLIKKIYKNSRWVASCSRRELQQAVRNAFMNKYRCDLYSNKIQTMLQAEHKRHWGYNLQQAQLQCKNWTYKMKIWGLTLKGSNIILPDYKAFL